MLKYLPVALGLLLASPAIGADQGATTLSPWKDVGDASRGDAYVHRWCSGCHMEAAGVATDMIPTFGMIADIAKKDPDELRAFLSKPHKPMPPLELDRTQIADFIAYFRQYK
jgi:mono/diheme cytochrome c family protein